jgi:hypothetical protein
VSRQWRDASSGEQAEQLQLFIDLRFMTAEQVTRAVSWMSMHGHSVEVLVIAADKSPAPQLSWFPAEAAALRNLRRLEMDHKHSLSLLTPVLRHLPQLQHLAAGVVMDRKPCRTQQYADSADGMFQNHNGQQREQMPYLGQLCPQLTHLHLRIGVTGGILKTDRQLQRLLPPRLQHLTLSCPVDGEVILRPMALTHLAALQQLTLEGVGVDGQVCRALAEHLGALQQLRVKRRGRSHLPAELLQQLGPKLVDYTTWRVPAAAQMVHLTRLVWRCEHQVPQGAAEALAALTGLQELHLGGCLDGSAAGDVMQAVAGMGQLRRLQLSGHVKGSSAQRSLSAALAQCTQLTALELRCVVLYDTSQNAIMLPVPQQLVGLRRLTVPLRLLEQDAGACLAPLTALTRLCVVSWMFNGGSEGAKKLLQEVAGWPASLQQVVLWEAKQVDFLRQATSCWTHTASQPGAARFGVRFEDADRDGYATVAQGWARPFRPFPHLPGVWELQGEVEGVGS